MTLQEQIETLDAIKRLRANPDFVKVFQTKLDDAEQRAHSALIDFSCAGEDLAVARAKYVAARTLNRYLPEAEAALIKLIAEKQSQKN